jgi:hypothetical protein
MNGIRFFLFFFLYIGWWLFFLFLFLGGSRVRKSWKREARKEKTKRKQKETGGIRRKKKLEAGEMEKENG